MRHLFIALLFASVLSAQDRFTAVGSNAFSTSPDNRLVRILQTGVRFAPTKAMRELGYAPRPLRETIADTVAWWRTRS